MMGFGAIGEFAIGESEEALADVVYLPVSRILSGGTMQMPKVLPEIGVDLINDEEDLITNDDGDIIGTEAR
jgi:hypothetical protein